MLDMEMSYFDLLSSQTDLHLVSFSSVCFRTDLKITFPTSLSIADKRLLLHIHFGSLLIFGRVIMFFACFQGAGK